MQGKSCESRNLLTGSRLLRRFSLGVTLLAIFNVILAPPIDATPRPVHVVLADTGTHKIYKVVYNYSCCSSKTVNTVYHPGDFIKVKWTPFADSGPSNVHLRLTAAIVGPFATAKALKEATVSHSSEPGLIRVSARAITVSNSIPFHPVSVIHIPKNAKPGFYNLMTAIVWLDGRGSGSGGSVIRVAG